MMWATRGLAAAGGAAVASLSSERPSSLAQQIQRMSIAGIIRRRRRRTTLGSSFSSAADGVMSSLSSIVRPLQVPPTIILLRGGGDKDYDPVLWRRRRIGTFQQQQQQRRSLASSSSSPPLLSVTDAARVSSGGGAGVGAPSSSSSSSIGGTTSKDSTAGDHQATTSAAASTNNSVPASFWNDLESAAQWRPSEWDVEFCRRVVTAYDGYLERLLRLDEVASGGTAAKTSSLDTTLPARNDQTTKLLDPRTVTLAFKTLLKCQFASVADLRVTVRLWERRIGQLGQTPLTDHLSLRLLTAHSKAGHLGRCLQLLELRAQRRFRPRAREFYFCVKAVAVAQAAAAASTSSRSSRARATVVVESETMRNIYGTSSSSPSSSSSSEQQLDNPTRWLDAILLNMKQRGVPLTLDLANTMLHSYVGHGYTGRAVHHFYRVVGVPNNHHNQTGAAAPAPEEAFLNDNNNNNNSNSSPRDWFSVPKQRTHVLAPRAVRLQFATQPPPFYKVPSNYLNTATTTTTSNNTTTNHPKNNSDTQLERETEPEYCSVPLTAAFAFAESLRHGACGHPPLELNVDSYNALLKACVFRGALRRAMHVLDHVLPNNNSPPNNRPNTESYNWLLLGLAKVGDTATAQKYFAQMISAAAAAGSGSSSSGPCGCQPNGFTVQALVDGLLNRGDAATAISVVQDCFNQYRILPSYTTHCKILEFCLASGQVYEAKRHVYFLQQLWHWKPGKYDNSKAFQGLMERTRANPQLQKPALQRLFAYFGERLDESDFL